MGDFFQRGYSPWLQRDHSNVILSFNVFSNRISIFHGVNTKTYHLTGEEISMKMKLRKYGDLSYQLTATQQEHPTQDWVSRPLLGINTYMHA